jgi:tight adherence protein B
MMRRALISLLAALAAFPAAAQAAGPQLTETAGERFPDRAYALALPKPQQLTASDVEVLENGKPVRGVSVTLADGTTARRFGVVLAIDTSDSMRGAPLSAAIAAAREFALHRTPGQPVAVITFNGSVDVVLPFTTDSAAIDSALTGVEQGGAGSRLADAAARAVELIKAAKMPSGSVVLLSDGGDWHSEASLDEVAAAARAANARVYGVGLPSRNERFGFLNLLAAKTSGEFSGASSLADLSRIYGRLGSRLAHQYLIQYHSAATPGRKVRVEVRVRGVGGAAVTGYRSPAVARTVGRPFHHVPAERVWLAPGTAVALGLVVAGLVFAALLILLRPRKGSLRDRVATYVEPPDETPAGAHHGGTLTSRMLGGAERSLEGRPWWDRFKETLDVGRIEIAPVRLLAWIGLGTVAVLALFTLIAGTPLIGLLAAAAVPVVAWRLIVRRVSTQRKRFLEQLPDSLHVIASAMRAGHSFSGALAVVVEDAPDPTRRELRRVISDERLGVPLEVAMTTAVQRMDSKDLEQVALVAALQRETGGNTAEVIDRVTEAVRQRLALRRMVAGLTAQGRMSRWVLTGIPIFLIVVLTVLSPDYMRPMFTTTLGRVLLGISAVMITSGSLVIKRIVDIKV